MNISKIKTKLNPCKDCKKRYPGCHSPECPDWVAVLEERKEKKEMLDRAQATDKEMYGYMRTVKAKNAKRKKK